MPLWNWCCKAVSYVWKNWIPSEMENRFVQVRAVPHACGQVASSTRQELSLFVGNFHRLTNGVLKTVLHALCASFCFLMLCSHAFKQFRIAENRWCRQILYSEVHSTQISWRRNDAIYELRMSVASVVGKGSKSLEIVHLETHSPLEDVLNVKGRPSIRDAVCVHRSYIMRSWCCLHISILHRSLARSLSPFNSFASVSFGSAFDNPSPRGSLSCRGSALTCPSFGDPGHSPSFLLYSFILTAAFSLAFSASPSTLLFPPLLLWSAPLRHSRNHSLRPSPSSSGSALCIHSG